MVRNAVYNGTNGWKLSLTDVKNMKLYEEDGKQFYFIPQYKLIAPTIDKETIGKLILSGMTKRAMAKHLNKSESYMATLVRRYWDTAKVETVREILLRERADNIEKAETIEQNKI